MIKRGKNKKVIRQAKNEFKITFFIASFQISKKKKTNDPIR